ncbi:VIT domain-containing protein [Spirulina sp. CS-785/01]|uniref:VIT domain-containing protein n=1 Tax=Spirulina sp. CS-785/01 TaxID=3021716 RepID=UPI00232BF5FD|nr:VIT domain-containing protein [Spirulina sp. CS-785/01]MDB9311734.1 VIT domain-containing protein [Spirulina sp. CS-785/01]
MNQPTTSPDTLGGLYAPSEGEKLAFPLKNTDVTAKVTGNLSRVQVTQTFENPFDEPLEAVYVFPLPDEAAVDDMEIQIGDRIIKGEIKKREEAREIYEQAREEGRTAGLLEQERANIFTQSLANIKPGEQISVTIRYTDSLKFEGGNYEFVFPMVVGPRYIPGTPINPAGDTDQVPDASNITPPVLPPETRSGHDINVTVEINAGGLVREINSPSHDIRTSQQGETVRVQLSPEDTIPNKDLILRYQVSGQDTQATVLTHQDEKGAHLALYLIPALDYNPAEIVPKDVVFLMDTSGSQRGEPLKKSKELMRRFINGLNPDDTFNIIDFANTAQSLSPSPLQNNAANRQGVLDYIEQLEANGGTELLNGIRAVLNYPPSSPGRLRSVVLLTDGYIGNERAILNEVQQKLKPGNRLYSFGVGSSVNRFLLDRLAEVGRGTMQVVRQDAPTQTPVETFFQQINNPVLTDIQVQWEGEGSSPEFYPQRSPDLFANQPLVLFGRKGQPGEGELIITGTTAGGGEYETTLPVRFNDEGNLAIAQLWGRAKIKDLMAQMYGGETVSGVEAVTETALAYRLLSQYTAFVAVSEEVRVDPDGTSRTVQVPVELPEGVSYEGIFGDSELEQDSYSGAVPRGSVPRNGRPMTRQPGILFESADSPPTPTAEAEESAEPAPSPSQSSPIEIIDADGLPTDVVNALEQHLQTLNFSGGDSGEVVFELRVANGRVTLVLWDEDASAINTPTVINSLRRRLQTWQPPQDLRGSYTLKFQINN